MAWKLKWIKRGAVLFYLICRNDQLLSFTCQLPKWMSHCLFLHPLPNFLLEAEKSAQLVKVNDTYLQWRKGNLANINFRCLTIFKCPYLGRQMHVYIMCSLIHKSSYKKYVTIHVKDLQNSLMHVVPLTIPLIAPFNLVKLWPWQLNLYCKFNWCRIF